MKDIAAGSEPTLSAYRVFLTLFKKEQFLNLPMYFFVLIPFVVYITRFARSLDVRFDLPRFPPSPYHLLCFFIFTVVGIWIIWWAYGYLVILGGGSPATHLGGTRRLVKVGPYSLIRHPSVIGKLFGLIGYGLFSQSLTFLLLFIPLLFAYSTFYNIFVQEKSCINKFGGEYLKYKRAVPMFIPGLSAVKEFIRGKGRPRLYSHEAVTSK